MTKSNTNFMRSNYRHYLSNGHNMPTDIYEAYEKPSVYKVQAWNYCKDLCKQYDGHCPVITGKNCMAFSVGFIGYVDGIKCYFHITKDYDRYLPLEIMDKETGEVKALEI